MTSATETVAEIIDGHAHVASTKFLPRAFVDGVVDNMQVAMEASGICPPRNKILSMYVDKMQDHDCTELLRQMDDAGIAKTVLLLPDFTYALPDSDLTIEEMFQEHQRILSANPDRFEVFAGVDPRWGVDGIDLFERGVREMGFKGLKLYPPCGYKLSDADLYPFYEICREHSLPVLTHVGGTSPALSFDTARPIFVDQPARDFKDLNFILAHGSSAYVEECVMLCGSRPNVYLDISAFQSKPLEALQKVCGGSINHKIIFGTDWPVFRMKGTQRTHLEAVLSENSPVRQLNERAQEGFFARTITRLINNRGRAATVPEGTASKVNSEEV